MADEQEMATEVSSSGVVGERAAKDRGLVPFIVTVEGTKIIATRCARSATEAISLFGLGGGRRIRAMQLDAAGGLHLHHDNGDCIPRYGVYGMHGSQDLVDAWKAAVESGKTVRVFSA